MIRVLVECGGSGQGGMVTAITTDAPLDVEVYLMDFDNDPEGLPQEFNISYVDPEEMDKLLTEEDYLQEPRERKDRTK